MAKKLIFIGFIVLVNVFSLKAQRILVVDNEGTPIPFVTVTTPEGKYVTSSDIDGWLEDVSGNSTLMLSQVAYKPLKISVSDIKDGRIVLEDASYDLPEVVVKPKELLYGQTYFRMTYIDDDGPVYYRSGVIDNAYEFAKKEMKSKSAHISKAQIGLIRFLVDRLAGKRYDKLSRLPSDPLYQKLTRLKDKGELTFTDAGNGRIIIADSVSTLGYIDWDAKELTRTVSFDIFRYTKHRENEKKRAKAEKKGKTFEEDTTMTVDGTFYQVYRTDSIGNSRLDDFVMSQYTQKGYHRHQGNNYIIQLQSFATSYAYIDKKEYKPMRKDNKVEMNILELRQFEKINKIPPLAPNIQEQVDKLFEKELKQ